MLQAVHVALSPTLRCLVNLFSEGAYSDRDLDASRVEEASCQIVAGVFHGNWCPRSSGLCDHGQAAVAASCTARRVKRRCQKLIAWRVRAAPTTLRLSSTVIIMGLCLCGLRQGRAIISCELFNSPAGQLMLNVKALPSLVEIKLLIQDRLAVCGVFEIAVGKLLRAQSSKTFAGTVTSSASSKNSRAIVLDFGSWLPKQRHDRRRPHRYALYSRPDPRRFRRCRQGGLQTTTHRPAPWRRRRQRRPEPARNTASC